MAQFENTAAIRKGLIGKPRNWSVALAARASLRIFPLAWASNNKHEADNQTEIASAYFLGACRCVGSAWAAAKFTANDPEIMAAAAAAAKAAHFVRHDAYAVDALRTTIYASSAASLISHDAYTREAANAVVQANKTGDSWGQYYADTVGINISRDADVFAISHFTFSQFTRDWLLHENQTNEFLMMQRIWHYNLPSSRIPSYRA